MNHIIRIVVLILTIILMCSLVSFNPKTEQKNLLEILEKAFKEKASFTKSFRNFNKDVREARQKAFDKFSIPLDTSKVTKCLVINQISLGTLTHIYGIIILNDTIVYNYYEDVSTHEIVVTEESGIFSDSVLVSMLQSNQFIDLEKLANEESEKLSGSFFYYVAFFDKNWDCTYARILPAFIKDDPNYR